MTGGFADRGVLYRISTSGDFEVLRSLSEDDAGIPFGELVLAGDGKFYGVSAGGGVGAGSLFRFDPVNSGFDMIYVFTNSTGANPQATLLLGSDGWLYGTTPNGGAEAHGTLFRTDTDGNFELLYSFSAAETNQPWGTLAELGGSIYGAAYGTFTPGVLFRWNGLNGFAAVHTFTSLDGSWPTGGLTAHGGFLYGVTVGGGAAFAGNVFRSSPDGDIEAIHEFDYFDGARPSARPIRVGTAWVGTTETAGAGFAGTVWEIPDAEELSTVCAFGNGEGRSAGGKLIEASDGYLYGTTSAGGLFHDQGTLFRMSKAGDVETLHSFNLLDGRRPYGGLVQGSDGGLFGTTIYGGADNSGVAFRLGLDGAFSLLRSYVWPEDPGIYPGPLAVGPDSEMYGTTEDGGECGAGTVYRLSTSGEPTTIYPSCGAVAGPLTRATDGFMYGVEGTLIIRLSTDGDRTVLYDFWASPVGSGPVPGLAEGPDGNLYGTSGSYVGVGSLYRLTPQGQAMLLHTFPYQGSAFQSASALIRGSDGRIYGTTHTSSSDDPGTIFRTNVYGDFETVYRFPNDDPRALSGVIEGSDGALYGLATDDVYLGDDLAFRLTLGTQVNAITPSSGASFETTPAQIAGSSFQDGATAAVGGQVTTDVQVLGPTQIEATIPLLFPGTLNDVVVTNTDTTSGSLVNGWFADFLDIPQDDSFHPYAESLFRHHVTAGYGNGLFGRNDPITRAQIAPLLLKTGFGAPFQPTACAPFIFTDVACPSLFADWINTLYNYGVTGGCGTDPLVYCPDAHVTRAQIAVFLLKMLHGSDHEPPPCAGVFDDVPCPGGFAVDWIEELYESGITGGCSVVPLLYCPDGPVSRGQMAVLLVRAFGLP